MRIWYWFKDVLVTRNTAVFFQTCFLNSLFWFLSRGLDLSTLLQVFKSLHNWRKQQRRLERGEAQLLLGPSSMMCCQPDNSDHSYWHPWIFFEIDSHGGPIDEHFLIISFPSEYFSWHKDDAWLCVDHGMSQIVFGLTLFGSRGQDHLPTMINRYLLTRSPDSKQFGTGAWSGLVLLNSSFSNWIVGDMMTRVKAFYQGDLFKKTIIVITATNLSPFHILSRPWEIKD